MEERAATGTPRFLVVRLSSLGDVVCTLPVAGALKAGHPGCRLTWAVDQRFAAIVERCVHVDTVWLAKQNQHELRATTFDVAFDMQGLLKSAWIVHTARANRRLGYHWQREGSRWFSSPVLPDPSSLHVVDQYVDVARAAGGVADQADFGLRPLMKDLDSVREKLAGVERFVAINPGAAWKTKRWAPSSVATLVDRLAAAGLPCVLIGGKSEAETQTAADVAATCRAPVTSLVGQTSLGELVGLISLAAAHVGSDTGSTHIAAALGVPAVGLYSLTKPERSCPYGQRTHCLVHPEGINAIAPEDVAEKVMEVRR